MAGCTGWSGDWPPDFQYLHEAAGMTGGRLDGGHQILGREVVRAGAGDQQPFALDEGERELIELAVGGLPLRNILLALDECRRIEHHDIEALTPLVQRLHCVEGICANRLQRDAVRLRVARARNRARSPRNRCSLPQPRLP